MLKSLINEIYITIRIDFEMLVNCGLAILLLVSRALEKEAGCVYLIKCNEMFNRYHKSSANDVR